MERPSYLYGTMHVSNKVAFNLGDPFFDALESVDQVALELEPEDWFKEVLDGDLMSSSMRYGMGNNLLGLYGGGSWNEFEGRLAYPENINLKIQESFRTSPRMINQLLFRFYDPSGNFEEETWLDMYIYQSARKLGKKTHGLETFQESMGFLKQAEKESRKNPKNYSQTDYQSRMDAQMEIENAYRKGDLDLLDSLSLQLNHKSFTKYILIERNKQFIHGMDSLMRVRPLFTGVGAAHLPGKEGCIEMLRTLGYTVKPVKMGLRDTARKDRLSESVMKHELKQFTSTDGRVSFTIPGETYELTVDPRKTSYFSMDIPNGLTFMLDMMVTGNAFQQRNPDYLLASLDSMLFEIIPGDILSQKKVQISGLPGYDIIHEVARGDVNRTMILFSPQEVISARLAGSGDKVNRGAGEHYFSSLKITLAGAQDQQTVFGPFGTFQVEMYGHVIDYSRHKPTILGSDLILQSVDADQDIFQVHRLQEMEQGYIDDDRYILDKVAKAFAHDYDSEEIERKFGLKDGRKYLDASYSQHQGKPVYGRYIKSGNTVYALHCYSHDPTKATRFLESISLSTPEYSEQVEHLDSSMFYASTIPWDKKDNYFERMFSMSDYGIDRTETLDEYSQSANLIPLGSDDKLKLEYLRHGRYTQVTDKTGYLENQRVILSGGGDLVIDSEDYRWNETGYVADFMLSDSLSNYRYLIHKILDGSRELTVTYGHDGISGSSTLYSDFISGLRLLEDSLSRTDYFSNDPSLLIEDLQSNDTTLFTMANEYLQSAYDLSEEWEYAIGHALKEKSSSLASVEDKKKYVSLYNKVRFADSSEEMIESLEKAYRQSSDSASYQKEILGLYAKMKNERAIRKIKELLLDDPPVGIHMNVYDPLFSGLQDSLELAAKLYPDIMVLTEYPEYKNAVLGTLAMLVDSNAISMSNLKKYKGYLERQAKIEFKRFQSTGYSVNDDSFYYGNSGVDISDYWSILWPWRNKKEVASLYSKAEMSSKTEVKKAYALFKLDRGLQLSDERIAELRPIDKPLEDFAFLKKIERLDLFPPNLDIQEYFVKEKVETQFREYEYDWDEGTVDSLAFISTGRDSIRTNAFTSYFVKSRTLTDGKENWQLNVVLVDESSEAPNFEFIHTSDEVSELKSEEEQFDLLLKQLIASNRTWPYYNQRKSMDLFSF